MINESTDSRFKRLAKQRGERALKNIQLLGNLSNRNNYEYSEEDVRHVFSVIENELRAAKARFKTSRKREIKF